jgi:hypothetical protein
MWPSGQVNVGETARRIPLVILAYMLWLASAALSLWAGLWLRTVLVVDVPIGLFRVSAWSLRLWNFAGSAVVGLAWLIFVLVTEGYFAKSAKKTLPMMLKRAARVLAAEGVFLGVVYGIHRLI